MALGSEILLRGERVIACFLAFLLLMTTIFRGVGRGELPIELSLRGARYEETEAAAVASATAIPDLVRRVDEQETLARTLASAGEEIAETTLQEILDLTERVERLEAS